MDDAAGREFARSTLCKRKIGYSLGHGKRASERASRCAAGRAAGLTIRDRLPRPEDRNRDAADGVVQCRQLRDGDGAGVAVGIDPEANRCGLAAMTGAPGRFERVEPASRFDHRRLRAHARLARTIVAQRARTGAPAAHRGVRCGGDRDPLKRSLMGQVAARLAHQLIITKIIRAPRRREHRQGDRPTALKAGTTSEVKWEVLLDRRAAIRRAIALADKGDLGVIAGKGHEAYPILGKTNTHFDDREEARESVLKP